jgi:hypothetical protein
MPKFRVFVQHRLAREANGKASTRRKIHHTSKNNGNEVLSATVEPSVENEQRQNANTVESFLSEPSKEERDLPVSESRTGSETISDFEQGDGDDDDDGDHHEEQQTRMKMSEENAHEDENCKEATFKEWSTSPEGRKIQDNDRIVYPDWTKNSFEPWSKDEGDVAGEDDEDDGNGADDELTVQETDSEELLSQGEEEEEQGELAILRSKEEDVQDDTSVASTAASADSEGSDLKAFQNFLKVFECEPRVSNVSKDDENNDDDAEAKTISFDHAPVETETEERVLNNVVSSHGSIFSAFSSPSRRSNRTWRTRTKSIDEMEGEPVDSVFEMSPMNIETSPKEDTVISHQILAAASDFLCVPSTEQIGPDSPRSCLDNYNTNETSKQAEVDVYPVPFQVVPSKNFVTSNQGMPQITIPWSSRKRFILTDQETSLPDNLPPMARLRYCNQLGGRETFFVSRERCYV